MEVFNTYIVRVCRGSKSEPPRFTGIVEEVGVQGKNHGTFSSCEELCEILKPKGKSVSAKETKGARRKSNTKGLSLIQNPRRQPEKI
jgi:hypothetical protein